jgi:predicted protein tyrosine phosphatase
VQRRGLRDDMLMIYVEATRPRLSRIGAAEQLDGAKPANCGLGLSSSILELAGRLTHRVLRDLEAVRRPGTHHGRRELFRMVHLPPGVTGALYLHSMLGKEEALADAVGEVRRLDISLIVSLAPLSEIRVNSPSYAKAIEAQDLPAILASCPIPDRGVPENQAEFLRSVEETASALEAGQKLLLHCNAGIGRTGTYAAAVLMRIGLSKDQAIAEVRRAGSHPETPKQLEFLSSLDMQD